MRNTNVIEYAVLIAILVLVWMVLWAKLPTLVKPPTVKVVVEKVRL